MCDIWVLLKGRVPSRGRDGALPFGFASGRGQGKKEWDANGSDGVRIPKGKGGPRTWGAPKGDYVLLTVGREGISAPSPTDGRFGSQGCWTHG